MRANDKPFDIDPDEVYLAAALLAAPDVYPYADLQDIISESLPSPSRILPRQRAKYIVEAAFIQNAYSIKHIDHSNEISKK